MSPKNFPGFKPTGNSLCTLSSFTMILWGRVQGLFNSAMEDFLQGKSPSAYTLVTGIKTQLWGSPHWSWVCKYPNAKFSSQCCYMQPPAGKWWKRQQHQQMYQYETKKKKKHLTKDFLRAQPAQQTRCCQLGLQGLLPTWFGVIHELQECGMLKGSKNIWRWCSGTWWQHGQETAQSWENTSYELSEKTSEGAGLSNDCILLLEISLHTRQGMWLEEPQLFSFKTQLSL